MSLPNDLQMIGTLLQPNSKCTAQDLPPHLKSIPCIFRNCEYLVKRGVEIEEAVLPVEAIGLQSRLTSLPKCMGNPRGNTACICCVLQNGRTERYCQVSVSWLLHDLLQPERGWSCHLQAQQHLKRGQRHELVGFTACQSFAKASSVHFSDTLCEGAGESMKPQRAQRTLTTTSCKVAPIVFLDSDVA